MRCISPDEIKLATLKYNDDPQKGSLGYYIHVKFRQPTRLGNGQEPQRELCTLVHSTPESAYENFTSLFDESSEAKRVQKRTLIDACDFIY